MKNPIQIVLLRDCDQLVSGRLCSSPQLVEAWKGRELMQSRCRRSSGNGPHVAFFGRKHVQEGLSHAAKRSDRGGVKLCVGQLFTGVEQTQVRPEIVLKDVGESCGHGFILLTWCAFFLASLSPNISLSWMV